MKNSSDPVFPVTAVACFDHITHQNILENNYLRIYNGSKLASN